MKLLLTLHLIMILFLTPGCGTDSGNPALTSNTEGIPQNSTLPALVSEDFIGYALCEKIAACIGSAPTKCTEKILSAKNISEELGADPDIYPNLAYIIYAINTEKKLTLNQSNVSDCKTAITNLSCSDTLFSQSYTSEDSENLDNTYNLLKSSTSCSEMINP